MYNDSTVYALKKIDITYRHPPLPCHKSALLQSPAISASSSHRSVWQTTKKTTLSSSPSSSYIWPPVFWQNGRKNPPSHHTECEKTYRTNKKKHQYLHIFWALSTYKTNLHMRYLVSYISNHHFLKQKNKEKTQGKSNQMRPSSKQTIPNPHLPNSEPPNPYLSFYFFPHGRNFLCLCR